MCSDYVNIHCLHNVQYNDIMYDYVHVHVCTSCTCTVSMYMYITYSEYVHVCIYHSGICTYIMYIVYVYISTVYKTNDTCIFTAVTNFQYKQKMTVIIFTKITEL